MIALPMQPSLIKGMYLAVGLLLVAPLRGATVPTAPSAYVFGRADFQPGNLGRVSMAGDFNGDDRLDFAALSLEGNSVSILLAQSGGSYADPGSTFAVGTSPVAASTGDFNSDGHLDLAVVNLVCPFNVTMCPPGTVSVLLGNGAGSFQPQVEYPTAEAPIAIVVNDFNGDGKVDLAVADKVSQVDTGSPGMVSLLLGNGDGTFQPTRDFAAGIGVSGLVSGDFDGDGRQDLVVLTHPSLSSTTLPVLLGNGDGSFQPLTLVEVGGDPIAVTAVDLNQDGKLDLAVATGARKVAVLLGQGDGTFQAHVDHEIDGGSVSIAVADLDGDGKRDVLLSGTLAAPFSGSLSILRGNGDGTLRPPIAYVTGSSGPLFVSDLNADGELDVGIGSVGRLRVGLGRGDGTFLSSVEYPTAVVPNSVASADFNRDGKADLALTSDTNNRVSILLGNGNGTFGPHVDFATGDRPVRVTAADFNVDGNADIAVANFVGNSVSVLPGHGDGSFGDRADLATCGGPSSVAAADFDGDGRPDLAVTCVGEASIAIFLGNGDETFKTRVDYPTGPGPDSISAADLNMDGKLDLVVADTGTPVTLQDPGLVTVHFGNGDGTFGPRIDVPVGGSLTPISLVAEDLSGDGKRDLAVAARLMDEIGFVVVLLGDGNGTFQDPAVYESGWFVSDIGAADFNADGVPDLAAVNTGSNKATLFKGRGDGTFQIQSDYGTGVGPIGLATGDFNGDSQPDLVTGVLSSGTVSVLLSGAVPTPDFALSAAPLSQTVSRGQAAIVALSVAPIGGFNGIISLSCGGLPAKTTCSVTPSSFAVDPGRAVNATVTITTTGPAVATTLLSAKSLASSAFGGGAWLVASGMSLLFGVLRAAFQRRRVGRLFCIAGLTALLLALGSCGGGGGRHEDTGTPPGTYSVVLSATNGAITHPVHVTLIVH